MAGVLGYGEIGMALTELYKKNGYDIRIFDPYKEKYDKFDDISVLNICIPFSEKFVDIVSEYVTKYNPQLTIIHSTVMPETTKQIVEKTKNKNIAYSFVRGIHPHLTKSLEIFVKYIGTDNAETTKLTEEHFGTLNIKSKVMSSSTACELSKLLSTTQYGLNIAFADCMEKMCKKYNLDYAEVVNEPNKTYNQGYKELGYPQYARYQLIPPSYFDPDSNPPRIGAHCVSENLELLLEIFPDDPGLQFIKKYSKFNRKS